MNTSAAFRTAIQPRHVRFRAGFINENEPVGSHVLCGFTPQGAFYLDIFTVLLGSFERLFLYDRFILHST